MTTTKTLCSGLLVLLSATAQADNASVALTTYRAALLVCQTTTLERELARTQCDARANSDFLAASVSIKAATPQTSAAAQRRRDLAAMADERRQWLQANPQSHAARCLAERAAGTPPNSCLKSLPPAQ